MIILGIFITCIVLFVWLYYSYKTNEEFFRQEREKLVDCLNKIKKGFIQDNCYVSSIFDEIEFEIKSLIKDSTIDANLYKFDLFLYKLLYKKSLKKMKSFEMDYCPQLEGFCDKIILFFIEHHVYRTKNLVYLAREFKYRAWKLKKYQKKKNELNK